MQILEQEFIPNQSEVSHSIIKRSTLIDYSHFYADKKLLRILFMEFIGTTIFGIGLQSSKNDLDIQMTIMFAMLFSFRHSGAHYHMAVTLILMYRPHHSIEKIRGILQMLVGVLGFMNGSLLSQLLFGSIQSPSLQSREFSWIIADLIGEVLATTSFQFVNVLLFERNTALFKTPLYNMILLDVAIFYSRKLSPHSGGCMNPTIAIGFSLGNALIYNKSLDDLWLFIVGPMIGSLIVFLVYYKVIYVNEELCRKIRRLGRKI